jgi:hypothetical protein
MPPSTHRRERDLASFASLAGARAMAIQEELVVSSTDRTSERQVAGEALARLPELFAMHHGPHHASMAFSYIANRLFCLAANPGELQITPIPEDMTPTCKAARAKGTSMVR